MKRLFFSQRDSRQSKTKKKKKRKRIIINVGPVRCFSFNRNRPPRLMKDLDLSRNVFSVDWYQLTLPVKE